MIPVGEEIGVWLPLALGALPHVSRALRGEPRTEESKDEAARMVVKACIVVGNWKVLVWKEMMLKEIDG